LLQRWRVPTAVDDMQGGVRQRLLIQLTTIDWHDGILFTPNDQRRDLDPTHIRRQLRVMDLAAFDMCREARLPILVFNYTQDGAIERAVAGHPVGTIVSA